MAFLVSRCTVIHNNKAQRACTGTTFPSRSIPDRGKRNEKCSLSRVWRCTLLAALFLFFLLWSADRFFFSLFFLQLRVSFRIKDREVSIFFYRLLTLKRFSYSFSYSSIFLFSENNLREWFPRSKSVEFYMEFYMEWIFNRVWLTTNEKPWNWICGQWGKSGRVPTIIRYGENWERGEGGNDRPFGKLADENESSIGYALHCSWQLVALLARGTN